MYYFFVLGGVLLPYIPPEIVEKAKEMDVLTYLQNYEPNELMDYGIGFQEVLEEKMQFLT